jgi:HEAT repeat protein
MELTSTVERSRTIELLQKIACSGNVTGVTVAAVHLAGSSDDEIRRWAAEAMEAAIIPVPSEVDELAELLYEGRDGEICYWAATMLGRLGENVGPRTRTAVNALELCLSDSLYLPARERAAWALSQLGPAAASAATTLRRTAEDAPPRLRKLVTKALRVIGEAA